MLVISRGAAFFFVMRYLIICPKCWRQETRDQRVAIHCPKCGTYTPRGRRVAPCYQCGGDYLQTPSGSLICEPCGGKLISYDHAEFLYCRKMKPIWAEQARLRKIQWDKDDKIRRKQEAIERERVKSLPLAVPVEGAEDVYTIDGEPGVYRLSKVKAKGEIEALVINLGVVKRRSDRVKARWLQRVKRYKGITLKKDGRIPETPID